MTRTWITADPHFYHTNLLRGQRIGIRPFDTLADMHDMLIANWNRVVAPNDRVFVLGDLTLENHTDYLWMFKSSLHGRKYLILGNHDRLPVHNYLDIGFADVMASRTLLWGKRKFLLTHIPVHQSAFVRHTANIHGHTHERHVSQNGLSTRSMDPRYINVCVETRDYTPVLLDQLVEEV